MHLRLIGAQQPARPPDFGTELGYTLVGRALTVRLLTPCRASDLGGHSPHCDKHPHLGWARWITDLPFHSSKYAT